MFRNYLRQNPICDCGSGEEDAEHYLFKCKLFTEQRLNLFLATRPFHPINTEKLLFGNPLLNDVENEFVFSEVQKFIKHSKRF